MENNQTRRLRDSDFRVLSILYLTGGSLSASELEKRYGSKFVYDVVKRLASINLVAYSSEGSGGYQKEISRGINNALQIR